MTTDWKYTEPSDKACWTGLKTFTDDKCATAEGTATVDATGTVEKLSKTWYVVSCADKKMTVYKTDKTTDADAKTAYEAATADAKDVEFAVTKGSADVACTAWPKGATDLYATWTASGYAADANSSNSTNASGAKTLAAAFAAGALAVAATDLYATWTA